MEEFVCELSGTILALPSRLTKQKITNSSSISLSSSFTLNQMNSFSKFPYLLSETEDGDEEKERSEKSLSVSVDKNENVEKNEKTVEKNDKNENVEKNVEKNDFEKNYFFRDFFIVEDKPICKVDAVLNYVDVDCHEIRRKDVMEISSESLLYFFSENLFGDKNFSHLLTEFFVSFVICDNPLFVDMLLQIDGSEDDSHRTNLLTSFLTHLITNVSVLKCLILKFTSLFASNFHLDYVQKFSTIFYENFSEIPFVILSDPSLSSPLLCDLLCTPPEHTSLFHLKKIYALIASKKSIITFLVITGQRTLNGSPNPFFELNPEHIHTLCRYTWGPIIPDL